MLHMQHGEDVQYLLLGVVFGTMGPTRNVDELVATEVLPGHVWGAVDSLPADSWSVKGA